MKERILIKNGTLVFFDHVQIGDIAIENEKIIAVEPNIPDKDFDLVIDATNKYVLPGAIDAHVHLAMPFGGTVSTDDYESGSRAALHGGVTTYIDYAIQKRGDTLLDILSRRQSLAKNVSYVDYAFHIAITDFNAAIEQEFAKLPSYGVRSVKCFMVYRKENMMIDDQTLEKIMTLGKKYGVLVNVHAEDVDMLENNVERLLSEKKVSNWYHYISRDEEVEYSGVKKAIEIAKRANAPLYVVHNACKDGIEAIKAAKENGQIIYAETCPQYLYFTSDVYKSDRAALYVCSPSIKGEASRAALWRAIDENVIDTIATDHCPFKLEEKAWGENNFTKTPNGCDGIENLYAFVLSKALEGKMSISKAVELVSHNPAKIFNLNEKGDLVVGKDADIVIFNPNDYVVYHNKDTFSNEDNSIWEGVKYQGKIETVLMRGKVALDKGKILIDKNFGKYIKR